MMATVLPRPVPPHRSSSTLTSSYQSIDSLTSPSTPCQLPVPNKHIPICPPGPAPDAPDIPPQVEAQSSLLHPPNNFARFESGNITIFKIDAAGVAAALDHISRQPLPEPSQVFPWFHGLHPNNHIQQAFFIHRRRALRRTPECLRSITVVKADGDLSISRLKGAIAPHEFLSETDAEFLEVDPREGFSVRNFQIQAAKTAMTSDIIVYGDDEAQVRTLGWKISTAQSNWRKTHHDDLPEYNTFICTSPFGEFETLFNDIVAVDSTGQVTGKVVDFFHQERREMYAMTQASEISHNVWMGPTPEVADEWDVLIECSDLGRLNPAALETLSKMDEDTPVCLDFPSSGSILPPTWSHTEADGILETCKWIYHISHGTRPSPDEDDNITACKQRKILIHCADGYTESTMLGIAYFSYSTGRPVPEAWLTLHTVKRRNFFAYPTDVALLTAIAPRLLHESPVCANRSLSDITAVINDEPKWLASLDGSFPSRILDYMYLGNLGHANNPDLLKALGITQILSVGETAMWPDGKLDEWGEDNICLVQGVQDNGIDPLTEEFARCLEFIDRGRRNDTATLVHCRVGVSRSATICIAEVMRSLHLSFPRAYCFVRARRLNVIIQPHLRFAYELLKWEEVLQGDDIKRELEWGEIAREVALMNRPYAR